MFMMRFFSTLSAILLCISFLFASIGSSFILVGRNGVGRGDSLKASNIPEKSIGISDNHNNNNNKNNEHVDNVSKYFGSSTTSGSKDSGNSNSAGVDKRIAKCHFSAAANMSKDEQLPSFYIPAKDKELYESGVRELLAQATDEKTENKNNKTVGGSPPSIVLECEEVRQALNNVSCRLCMYNEISKDKKHLRQGQVLDVLLDTCIHGTFGNDMNVGKDNTNSYVTDYHPICYPPTTSVSNNNNEVTRNKFRNNVVGGNKYDSNADLQLSAIAEGLLDAVAAQKAILDDLSGAQIDGMMVAEAVNELINGDRDVQNMISGQVAEGEIGVGFPEAALIAVEVNDNDGLNNNDIHIFLEGQNVGSPSGNDDNNVNVYNRVNDGNYYVGDFNRNNEAPVNAQNYDNNAPSNDSVVGNNNNAEAQYYPVENMQQNNNDAPSREMQYDNNNGNMNGTVQSFNYNRDNANTDGQSFPGNMYLLDNSAVVSGRAML